MTKTQYRYLQQRARTARDTLLDAGPEYQARGMAMSAIVLYLRAREGGGLGALETKRLFRKQWATYNYPGARRREAVALAR